MDAEQLLPPIVEPQRLLVNIDNQNIRIVDLCKHEIFNKAHVPGAIHLEYRHLVRAKPPVMGLLPDANDLKAIAETLGLTPDTHVVAYDDEGGGKAARLLWTLDIIGHSKKSLLNGGLHAWVKEKFPLEKKQNTISPSKYTINMNTDVIADRYYILHHLHNKSVEFVDTRSLAEYTGEKKYSLHGGHIPGAINMDWLTVIDRNNNMKLKPENEIRRILQSKKITSDKIIVTYCQTNHRSALIYYVLKVLHFPIVKAYPGSWSDWGNRNDTPINLYEIAEV